MPSKMWDGITYPLPNFNGSTVEVWKWISHFISHIIKNVVSYPCWDSLNHISQRGSEFSSRAGFCLASGWRTVRPACSKPHTQPEQNISNVLGLHRFGLAGNRVTIQGNMPKPFNNTCQHCVTFLAVQIQISFLQPDNAFPHTTRDTVAWFDNQGFQRVLWPEYFPDVNIIEMVMGRIMNRLYADPSLTIIQLR